MSFVAAPGVHLPALPSTSYRSGVERLASRGRERLYGSRLVVLPSTMNASATEIVASVRRHGDVPVR